MEERFPWIKIPHLTFKYSRVKLADKFTNNGERWFFVRLSYFISLATTGWGWKGIASSLFPQFLIQFWIDSKKRKQVKVALPRGTLILDIVPDKCGKVQIILQLSSAIVASPVACLSRVYFSRYPPNGGLDRRLIWRGPKSFVKFSMRLCERAGWLGSRDLGFSNSDLRKFSIQTLVNFENYCRKIFPKTLWGSMKSPFSS